MHAKVVSGAKAAMSEAELLISRFFFFFNDQIARKTQSIKT